VLALIEVHRPQFGALSGSKHFDCGTVGSQCWQLIILGRPAMWIATFDLARFTQALQERAVTRQVNRSAAQISDH
jgi:hypothetical protein